mmetsp:Transcript_82026/g.244675  ORF Transcript_82026/g.244675 Transcript_82026/m.244675 type:complete len:225 (-) Transcript_82026:37-711(-)
MPLFTARERVLATSGGGAAGTKRICASVSSAVTRVVGSPASRQPPMAAMPLGPTCARASAETLRTSGSLSAKCRCAKASACGAATAPSSPKALAASTRVLAFGDSRRPSNALEAVLPILPSASAARCLASGPPCSMARTSALAPASSNRSSASVQALCTVAVLSVVSVAARAPAYGPAREGPRRPSAVAACMRTCGRSLSSLSARAAVPVAPIHLSASSMRMRT